MSESALRINGVEIAPGSRSTIDLPIARLYTHAPLTMPVQVVRGKKDGPRLFVSAAIHGDEINGVEIIRRLMKLPVLKRLRGTVVAVPVVNVFGFVNRSRYLPDRRDLNRSFPGSEKGSMAARLAHVFLSEIVANCTHGIDLHTAAVHRENLPQIRANLDHPDTNELAHAFGVPVLLNSDLRDGSLRECATESDIPILLYEAGEALRFDEVCIRAGLQGILSVMRKLEMLPASRRKKAPPEPTVARRSFWVRASQSGILRAVIPLGRRVRKGDVLGMISDPYGDREVALEVPVGGVIIGRATLPLVNEGEALFHIARFDEPKATEAAVEEFHTQLSDDALPLLDEEPPIV